MQTKHRQDWHLIVYQPLLILMDAAQWEHNQKRHILWIQFLSDHKNQRQFKPKAYQNLTQPFLESSKFGLLFVLFFQYKVTLHFRQTQIL